MEKNNKIINCARCGTNPWKQGCYAMWGKSPEPLLYKKGEDSGYICSVCASYISHNPKFDECPVYGWGVRFGLNKQGGKSE